MNSNGRKKRGMTLIELLTAITLAAIGLSSVAFTLHFLHRLNQSIRSEIAHDTSLPRLSNQLRVDAHAATSCELPGSDLGPDVVMQVGGEQVEYHGRTRRVERRVVVDGRVVRREQFRLRDAESVAWEIDNAPLRQLVLQIHRRNRVAPQQVDVVAASIGLDRHYQRQQRPSSF